MAQVRRLTGATMAVAYGAASDTAEIAFTGSSANYMQNCYQAEIEFNSDEIDTTAFGDYPFGTAEPGFIDMSISLSMRNAAGAADVTFLDNHAVSRVPFRIAIIENKTSLTTNGWLLSVVCTSMKGGGEAKGAQDKTYTLKRSAYGLPIARIIDGVATPVVISM